MSEPPGWHAKDIEEVFQQLNTSSLGLSEDEAKIRLKKYGSNSLEISDHRYWFVRLLSQFNQVLIYVLLISAAVTGFLGYWVDMMVILAAVMVNTAIGFIQEGKAEKALNAIRHMLSLRAVVVRENKRQLISAKNLTLGDIVLLKSGDKVPADLRLIDIKGLQIQEAALTGESYPIEKNISKVAVDADLAERMCMAYSGTMVVSGKGMGVVVAIGKTTEVGKIGSIFSHITSGTTPLLEKMTEFSYWLTAIILGGSVFTFLFGFYFGDYPLNEILMAAVSFAVAAIPEGLPAIMTIVLAIGASHMAKRNAIIRKLAAIETLGAVTVICTDKTGTLTTNQLQIKNIITADGIFAMDNIPDHVLQFIEGAALCVDPHAHGNPVDNALANLVENTKLDPESLRNNYPVTDWIPFESEHKLMATLHHDHQGNSYIYAKGAPERIIQMCADHLFDKNDWMQKIDELAISGQRLIAIAKRKTSAEHQILSFKDLEEKFEIQAIFGLLDSPRPEVDRAIAECHAAGIRVIMVTGDYVATAKSIAKQLHFPNYNQALSGHELDALSAVELSKLVDKIDIYARTSPIHKLKLVEVLQNSHQIVAMTGDGVNDMPALKCANVGIAMGQKGTEAAKEAAEIVLADDNFASIVLAIKEGRTVFDNLSKTILFALPTNGGQSLVILVAVLVGWLLPITPVQILWVNLVTSVTLALALAFEPSEENIMNRPPRQPDAPILSSLLLWRIIFVSALLLAGCFGFFIYGIKLNMDVAVARSMAVNALVIGQVGYLFNTRQIHNYPYKLKNIFRGRAVWLAVIGVVFLQLIFTYLPWMQNIFQVKSLSILQWIYIIIYGFLVIFLIEFEKIVIRYFRR